MYSGVRSYSIKELESFCGIKAHTIRMWEKRYNILTPERSDTNIRYYTEDELKKLITISILNRHGIKISRIAHMSDEEILHAVMKSTGSEEDTANVFNPGPLIMAALKFSESQLRKSLLAHIEDKGLEEAYIKVFYPLMQKSHTLWLTDCLSKTQEQFIDFIIRSIIINEDNSLDVPTSKESIVVADISGYDPYGTLLFMKYLLKKSGFDVIYTDGVHSADEISAIQLIKPFQMLALNTGTAIPDEELKELLVSFIKKLKLRKIIVTGRDEPLASLSDSRIKYAFTPAEMSAEINRI
ncbi:MAG TPA: MerR family transcriptional regulator [Bacteroidales bacterium]|nr:MerR family transcriptional regulator [Bacteroidales bacterium]